MDGFWHLIDRAREQAGGDVYAVAERARDLLAGMAPGEIIAARQLLWDQLAGSSTAPLWAAAYMINGGCSDDGFEYFRGWLVAQGREVFERASADADRLAEHAPVRAAAAEWEELECEAMLGIAGSAYERVTGEAMPRGSWHVRYPELAGDFWLNFEDSERLDRMLPRLALLYGRGKTG